VLEPDPDSCELTLTRLHPGSDVDAVRAATGWKLAVAPTLGRTDPPTAEELEILRGLSGSTSGAQSSAQSRSLSRKDG
jgi:glutaconate CoA-transferase subunit B